MPSSFASLALLEREAALQAEARERYRDVPVITEASEAEREREETQRARRRERAQQRKAQALLRSRLLLSEHSTDSSIWPRLLIVRRCHGKQGAISFCLGAGIQPEAVERIVAGLPSGKR